MASGNGSNIIDDSDFDFAQKEAAILNYYNDLPNIFDDLESRPGWPQSLLSDHHTLKEAAKLWLDVSQNLLFSVMWIPRGDGPMRKGLITHLPFGFEELTRNLSWWCDAGPTSIDPSPLRDFLRIGDDLTDDLRWGRRVMLRDEVGAARNKLWEVFSSARDVLNRMLYVAFMKEGEESPKLLTGLSNLDIESGTISYNGKTYANVDPDACLLLKELFDSYPDWKGLTSELRPHPERVIKKLPEPLQAIIETTNKGSRLILE